MSRSKILFRTNNSKNSPR